MRSTDSCLLGIFASWREPLSLGCLLLIMTLAGCPSGGKFERIRVSGEVTFRGEPVVKGQIRFTPKPGTSTPPVIEPISDGRYATTTSGGVPVGKYRVEIRAFDPNAPPPKTISDPPPRQLLPKQYNVNSQREVELKSGDGKKELDFHLE